jgi:membrane-bound lytic murein transglycosylase MltF
MKASPFNTSLMQIAGLSPFNQEDEKVRVYEEMDFDDLIIKQQFNESRFDGSRVSKAGAISIAQITNQTFQDGIRRGYVPKDTKFEDLAKDDVLAEKFQRAYIKDLMNRGWNTLGEKSESLVVQQAKALAAYNMGPTRLVNILNEMKADGIDIYIVKKWNG